MVQTWMHHVRRLMGFPSFPLLVVLLTGCPDNDAAPRATAPTLSALSLSAGQLNPAFDPSVITYDTMFIGNTSVTVTPTAASGTITVDSTPVTSGTPSGSITLPSGNTTITVVVTGTGARPSTQSPRIGWHKRPM